MQLRMYPSYTPKKEKRQHICPPKAPVLFFLLKLQKLLKEIFGITTYTASARSQANHVILRTDCNRADHAPARRVLKVQVDVLAKHFDIKM